MLLEQAWQHRHDVGGSVVATSLYGGDRYA